MFEENCQIHIQNRPANSISYEVPVELLDPVGAKQHFQRAIHPAGSEKTVYSVYLSIHIPSAVSMSSACPLMHRFDDKTCTSVRLFRTLERLKAR